MDCPNLLAASPDLRHNPPSFFSAAAPRPARVLGCLTTRLVLAPKGHEAREAGHRPLSGTVQHRADS